MIAAGGQGSEGWVGGGGQPRAPCPSPAKSFACGARLFIASQSPPTTQTSKRRAAVTRTHDDSLVIAELGHDAGQPGGIVHCLLLLAPGETWGFSKRKWGLKSGGKSPPRKQKWELKVGV